MKRYTILKPSLYKILLIVVLLVIVKPVASYAYGYEWAMDHTTYKYGGSLPESFRAGNDYGAAVWTSETGSNWVYAYNSGSSNHVDYVYIDGTNSVVAVTTKTITNGYITFFKIEYDNSENWYTSTGTPGSNQVDLRSVAAHEMGHGLGLLHTQSAYCPGTSSNATMCPIYGLGTTYFRTLEADDRDGLAAMYPAY